MANTNWETPEWFFRRCEAAWGPFGLDVSATKENYKCRKWLGECHEGTKWGGGLTADWEHLCLTAAPPNSAAWANPPYKNLISWVNKAIEESDKGLTVVMLLPWTRWAKWCEIIVKRAEMVRIPGRIAFLGSDKKPLASPPGQNVLAIIRPPIEGVTWPVGFTGAEISGKE